jgi:hypothetical protein
MCHLMRLVVAGVAVGLCLASAAPRAAAPVPPEGVATGVLDVRVRPEHAVVAVDGERRIPRERGRFVVTLAAGPHVIHVSCQGYASADVEVTIDPDTRRVMTISLAPPT